MNDATSCRYCGQHVTETGPFCARCGSQYKADVMLIIIGVIATVATTAVGSYFALST
jgi:predicted amidophosphoribosyltransferase